MSDQRKKDVNWSVLNEHGQISINHAHLAVLMDLRDELKQLNRLLGCQNFIDIPKTLRSISRKLATPRVKR